MARRNKGQKRREPAANTGINGEAEVDDIAVAATYAALVYTADTASTQKTLDSNEIDVSEDESDQDSFVSECGCSNEGEAVGDEEKKDEEDDSDSDKSVVDLTKERAAIQKMEEQENEAKVAPKTEHELDPYQTPLPELEKKFQLSLTVKDHEKSQLSSKIGNNANLCLAGNIKSHLVQDRTIIVESAPRGGIVAPLDEGSLLVLQLATDPNSAQSNQTLIPLGRIFEVFGPVRKPLYTLRLPPPAKCMKINTKKKENSDVSSETTDKDVQGAKETVCEATPRQSDLSATVEDATPKAMLPTATAKQLNETLIDERQTGRRVDDNEKMKSGENSENREATSAPISVVAGNKNESKETDAPRDMEVSDFADAPPEMAPVGVEPTASLETFKEHTKNSHANSGNGGPDATISATPQECAQGGKMQNFSTSEEADPWSNDGEYTKFLSGHPNLPIFYVQDEARLIDAESMLRMSARGCGKSWQPKALVWQNVTGR